MKKIINFLFLVIILSSFLFISCGKDCHEKFVGEWTLQRTIKQGFLEDEYDAGSLLGYVIIEQKINYTFNDDLNYEKTVVQTVVDCEKVKDESPNYTLLEQSIGSSVSFTVTGNYKANEKNLTLKATKINLNNEEFDYKDYYRQNPDIGLQNISLTYKIEENSLTINNKEISIDETYAKIK